MNEAEIRPTVVKVVYCSECRHHLGGYCYRTLKSGKKILFPMGDEDYCSKGERDDQV